MPKTRKSKKAAEPPAAAPEEVLDLAGAAEFLKVSKPTFYRWLAQEKIKGFKAGTQWRFYRKDLEEFLESEEPQVTRGEVEGLIEAVEQARAAKGLAPIDWEQDDEFADNPLARVVRTIVTDAIDARASDIHIDANREDSLIRYRVDGVLQEAMRIPREYQRPIIARLKLEGDAEIAQRLLPTYGRIRIDYQGRPYDVRTQTVPAIFGESLAMRILDQTSVLLGLDQLGMPESLQQTLRRVVQKPAGLIIATGPTGTGRTTTLYSMLSQVNVQEKMVITVEDPVEYQFRDVTQVHVNRRAGLTFPVALRTFQRCDPDVIMVGEIRDLETAEIVMQAAMTGHIVLACMLPLDTPSVITRLIEMGVEPFLVSAALSGALSQRLPRRLCQACREEHKPSLDLLRRLGLSKDEIASATFYRPVGCPECHQSGYRGRLGIFEFLEVDERLRELIARPASTNELRQAAIENGMVTLVRDGLNRAMEGMTTIEEVLRVTAAGQGAGESAAQA
jgi:excisionase family DNA binding protein